MLSLKDRGFRLARGGVSGQRSPLRPRLGLIACRCLKPEKKQHDAYGDGPAEGQAVRRSEPQAVWAEIRPVAGTAERAGARHGAVHVKFQMGCCAETGHARWTLRTFRKPSAGLTIESLHGPRSRTPAPNRFRCRGLVSRNCGVCSVRGLAGSRRLGCACRAADRCSPGRAP